MEGHAEEIKKWNHDMLNVNDIAMSMDHQIAGWISRMDHTVPHKGSTLSG